VAGEQIGERVGVKFSMSATTGRAPVALTSSA
jgi:hypothetical protein